MDEIGGNDDAVTVLIVDDMADNINVLRQALGAEGYEMLVATSGPAALRTAVCFVPDAILLDIYMPEMDGYEVCRQLKEEETTKDIPVVFITGSDEGQSLVQAFAVGGVDYITKPFTQEEVRARVRTHVQNSILQRTLRRQNQVLEERTEALQAEIARRQQAEEGRARADAQLELISAGEAERWGLEGFGERSPTIHKILVEVQQLQEAGDRSVLIQGESGTGKELLARAIHAGGSRARGGFIAVNCAAVPSELAESAFFGHVKGSFSGATADQRGYFELADGGTLFLDEIGDMPAALQATLLRVLEDGRIRPVGGENEKVIDVRVVAATNADLGTQMAEGNFRRDLYFRLARSTVVVPPLRQRREDIAPLARHFVQILAAEMGRESPWISPEVIAALEGYGFPGNVRELKNMIENALIKSGGETIEARHLTLIELPPAAPVKVEEAPAAVDSLPRLDQTEEERLILSYVEQHGSINNAVCRTLLEVDRRRASYLLDKLFQVGQLGRSGVGRGTRYERP